MPLSVKARKADVYVENVGSVDELVSSTFKKLNKILTQFKKK